MPHHHALIARPKGICGYEPGEWCAVCGKTVVNKPSNKCSTPACPNVCHPHCLNTQERFSCEDVDALRQHLGIADPVTYLSNTQEPPSCLTPSTSEEDAELHQLETGELVTIIKQLRKENRRYKSILASFDKTAENIADNRDAVVTILNFIDNIAATQSSLNNLTVTSIPCSARGHSIDKDWRHHIARHPESRDWWTSGKPRQLQRASTDTFTAATQSDFPDPIPAHPSLPPVTTDALPPQTTKPQQTPSSSSADSSSPTPAESTPAENTLPDNTPGENTPAENTQASPGTARNRKNTAATTTSDGHPSPNRSSHLTTTSPDSQPNLRALAQGSQSSSGQAKRRHAPPSTTQGTDTADARRCKSPSRRQSHLLPQRTPRHSHPRNTYTSVRPKPVPLLSLPTFERISTREFCNYCKKSGHTRNTCRWLSWCDYCYREGHITENCRAFLAQERHDKICRQLSEQTAITSLLVETLNKQLSQSPLSGHLVSQRQAPHPSQPPYTPWNYAGQPSLPRETDDYLY